jgi:phosphatidylglycerophosphate synthase
MSGGSWTHVLAARAVQPLIGTRVRPNHLTTMRLISGLAACAAFALGSRAGTVWGGAIWLVSAFLDRAAGELARNGGMTSAGGHCYDYYCDNLVNSVLFVAIGIGLRHAWLGDTALALGALAGGSLALLSWWSERLELLGPPGTRVMSSRWGFDPDDAFYLIAPFAWLGWLGPILMIAAVVIPPVAAAVGIRLLSMRRPASPGAASIRE